MSALTKEAALALRDTLPVPADLEGWDSDDVCAALQSVMVGFQERRLVVGLLLWKFRALNVDAVYSEKQAEVAQACDVDVRTLQRWRVFAETKWALPPPDRRTEGRRFSVEQAKKQTEASGRRHAVSPANSREHEPEKATVDEVIEATPVPASAPEPPVAKTPAPKPAQQLSLWDEREARPFFPSRPPASREEAAAAKAHGRAAIEWGMTYRPTPGRAAPVEREECVHPVTRRIGDSCGACGQKVSGK